MDGPNLVHPACDSAGRGFAFIGDVFAAPLAFSPNAATVWLALDQNDVVNCDTSPELWRRWLPARRRPAEHRAARDSRPVDTPPSVT
jgi:hypothetical protein